MKKIMILAAAAALVLSAACTKTEISSPNDEQHAIGLSIYTPRPTTKADGTFIDNTATAGLVNGKHFAVYANATTNGTAFTTSAIGTSFMSAVSVEFASAKNTASTGMDTYAPIRYWPSGDTPDYLTFWAYYPLETGNGITYTAPSGSNGMGSYSFTANATAASMVDFLVSDVVNDMVYTDGNKGIVPLVFHHMLTKVQFFFKTDATTAADSNTDVTLTNAQLQTITKNGTLATTYSSSANPKCTYTWTPGATTASYDITISGATPSSTPVKLSNTATTCAAGDVFLMVPQTIADNTQKINLTWTVKTFADGADHSSATPLSTTTNTKTIDLYDILTDSDARITWDMNKRVNYTITIGPKPIKFTANVETWGDLSEGAIEVN